MIKTVFSIGFGQEFEKYALLQKPNKQKRRNKNEKARTILDSFHFAYVTIFQFFPSFKCRSHSSIPIFCILLFFAFYSGEAGGRGGGGGRFGERENRGLRQARQKFAWTSLWGTIQRTWWLWQHLCLCSVIERLIRRPCYLLVSNKRLTTFFLWITALWSHLLFCPYVFPTF